MGEEADVVFSFSFVCWERIVYNLSVAFNSCGLSLAYLLVFLIELFIYTSTSKFNLFANRVIWCLMAEITTFSRR